MASALFALPITLAVLFVMTRLILPGDRDPVVSRMIQNIEFQRAVERPVPPGVRSFRRPLRIDDRSAPKASVRTSANPSPVSEPGDIAEDSPASNVRVRAIDWWAEARGVAQDSNEEALQRWSLEQGHAKYVSVMQGPLPITNSVKAPLPKTQEDITGYMNTFGDMEIKISGNCVAQTQVSARLDISDFAKHLPMRIMCKHPKKIEYSFAREKPN